MRNGLVGGKAKDSAGRSPKRSKRVGNMLRTLREKVSEKHAEAERVWEKARRCSQERSGTVWKACRRVWKSSIREKSEHFQKLFGRGPKTILRGP